eukprot:m.1055663 g.1055663  ORF g.1055663 m.1055663 type:complete len:292 (-) comp24194_c0_seq7:2401-3276(-)
MSSRCGTTRRMSPDSLADRRMYSVIDPTGIAVLYYNNPKKCNAWTKDLVDAFYKELIILENDDAVKVVLLTGTGRYFSSGADFGMYSQPMRLATLQNAVETFTKDIFNAFLDFPKPIIACVNGPAIGGAVTSASLCDVIICTTNATFHTPFEELGICAEGCSSYTFGSRYGSEFSRKMLQENAKLTASDALRYGFVREVIDGDGDALITRGKEIAKELFIDGHQVRSMVADKQLHSMLKSVNSKEAKQLASLVLSDHFFEKQLQLASKKRRHLMFLVMFVLRWTRPLWSRL